MSPIELVLSRLRNPRKSGPGARADKAEGRR
jgi:hypothetical protein